MKYSDLSKYGTTEKESIHTWDIKLPNNMEKLIIQNVLNLLSSFLLQFQESNTATMIAAQKSSTITPGSI